MSQLVDLRREVRTRQRTSIVVTMAMALVVVAGAFAVGTRFVGSDESAPPAGVSTTQEAQQVAADFFAAYDAFDADRMLTYFSDTDVVAGQWESTEGLRSDAAWREVAGWAETRSPCAATNDGPDVVALRCDYTVHALGSEQLGRGPFEGGYWALHVQDARIVYAHSEFPYSTNGYAAQMWEPFLAFVRSEYPDDAALMFEEDGTDSLKDEAAWPLWEAHVADYVASESAG